VGKWFLAIRFIFSMVYIEPVKKPVQCFFLLIKDNLILNKSDPFGVAFFYIGFYVFVL